LNGAGIGRRLRQPGHLIAGAGPWLAGRLVAFADLCGLTTFEAWQDRRSPSGAGPADAAAPGHPVTYRKCETPGLPVDGRPLDGYEQQAFASLALRVSGARVPEQGEGR
jgi:hypothetical protein